MKTVPNLSASAAQILRLKIRGLINQFKTHLLKKALYQCSHECNKIKAPLSGPARRRPNDFYFSFNPMPKFRPLIYISFSIYTRFRHAKDFYGRHVLWPEVEICQFTNKWSLWIEVLFSCLFLANEQLSSRTNIITNLKTCFSIHHWPILEDSPLSFSVFPRYTNVVPLAIVDWIYNNVSVGCDVNKEVKLGRIEGKSKLEKWTLEEFSLERDINNSNNNNYNNNSINNQGLYRQPFKEIQVSFPWHRQTCTTTTQGLNLSFKVNCTCKHVSNNGI